MATGDQNDVINRLNTVVPPWYGSGPSILTAVFAGIATAFSFLYSLYAYAKNQTRIKTATDGWLDIIAADYFGSAITRAANQSDTSFLATIIANLFREKATRHAVIKVLQDITGRTPIVYEPTYPLDTGAYGASICGYGVAGTYGSLLIPYQAFVVAFRPMTSGIPNIAGYGISTGAYGIASQDEYADLSMITGQVLDADIYAAINSVKPVGTALWVRISS